MPTHRIGRILAAVLAIGLASLSCMNQPGNAPPWIAGEIEVQELGREACDGTPYLSVQAEITSQGTNQFGTRFCEFTLYITNTNPEQPIHFYIFQHDQDGYAGTEGSQWMGNIQLDPVKKGSWNGSIYIYDDQDASGPVMSLPERIAGVFSGPECKNERQDETWFEEIAVPLKAVCPTQ